MPGENVRHEGCGEGQEEHGNHGDEGGNGSAQTATAGKEAGEEGEDLEEQGDEEEDPAEAPQVVHLLGGAVVGAADVARHAVGIAVPGGAEGRRGVGAAAVLVALAAHVEVGPLGDIAGAVDARGVGAQEVGVVERRGRGHAREDDEEEQDQGAGHQDEACDAEGGVLRVAC